MWTSRWPWSLSGTSGLFVILLALLGGLKPLLAEHTLVGEPPVIMHQPDVVVFSEAFTTDPTTGVSANLILPCAATGTPDPTVAWFRDGNPVEAELVNVDGTLVSNVTMGVEASVSGMTYYCTATSAIGSNPATVRSRDIIVNYTFFNGFGSMEPRVQVQTVESGTVALECDVLDASPRPVVEWFMNNGSTPIAEIPATNGILLLEEGRYLFIRDLTPTQRSAYYNCEVANAYLGMRRQRSPTTYNLTGDLPQDTLVVYRPLQLTTVILGQPTTVVYAAARLRSSDGTSATLAIVCGPTSTPAGVTATNNVLVTTFTFESSVTVRRVNITCALSGSEADLTFQLVVFEPAVITAPAEDDPELIDRELLVGGGQVSFECENKGIPTPTVIWFFNGKSIPEGVSENGNLLVISEPQVSHSGIYQCVVSNIIDGVVREDRRSWVLEIRAPVSPSVDDLTTSNPMAVSDRLEGTVILVEPPSTTNVTVTAVVNSDPCPTVQWSFNGTDISNGSPDYFIDACVGNPSSPHTFTLTIANLALNTSGRYSAIFNNLGGETKLPGLYVTVPVPVEVVRLELSVVNTAASCLLENRDAVMTCVITGFPRPEIQFRRQGQIVMPRMMGFERITNISNDQIEIASVVMSDEGQYACGTTTGIEMTATLDTAFCTLPRIVTQQMNPSELDSPVIRVGDELELECTIEGVPLPGVEWTKNNATITDIFTAENNIFISSGMGGTINRLRFESAAIKDNGVYRCVASNPAGSVSATFQVDRIMMVNDPILTTAAIIGIAAGGVGFFLIVVLLILLLVCVYLCARKSKAGSADFAYNVDYTAKPADYGDGRGNVDADSCDGGQPEAFDPDYDSVPTRRPHEPPPYKIAPSYQHGAPSAGEDLEMIKYPPQDESFVPPYSRPAHDNGYRQPPNAEDFLSEDAQFV